MNPDSLTVLLMRARARNVALANRVRELEEELRRCRVRLSEVYGEKLLERQREREVQG